LWRFVNRRNLSDLVVVSKSPQKNNKTLNLQKIQIFLNFRGWFKTVAKNSKILNFSHYLPHQCTSNRQGQEPNRSWARARTPACGPARERGLTRQRLALRVTWPCWKFNFPASPPFSKPNPQPPIRARARDNRICKVYLFNIHAYKLYTKPISFFRIIFYIF